MTGPGLTIEGCKDHLEFCDRLRHSIGRFFLSEVSGDLDFGISFALFHTSFVWFHCSLSSGACTSERLPVQCQWTKPVGLHLDLCMLSSPGQVSHEQHCREVSGEALRSGSFLHVPWLGEASSHCRSFVLLAVLPGTRASVTSTTSVKRRSQTGALCFSTGRRRSPGIRCWSESPPSRSRPCRPGLGLSRRARSATRAWLCIGSVMTWHLEASPEFAFPLQAKESWHVRLRHGPSVVQHPGPAVERQTEENPRWDMEQLQPQHVCKSVLFYRTSAGPYPEQTQHRTRLEGAIGDDSRF